MIGFGATGFKIFLFLTTVNLFAGPLFSLSAFRVISLRLAARRFLADAGRANGCGALSAVGAIVRCIGIGLVGAFILFICFLLPTLLGIAGGVIVLCIGLLTLLGTGGVGNGLVGGDTVFGRTGLFCGDSDLDILLIAAIALAFSSGVDSCRIVLGRIKSASSSDSDIDLKKPFDCSDDAMNAIDSI